MIGGPTGSRKVTTVSVTPPVWLRGEVHIDVSLTVDGTRLERSAA